MFTILAVCLFVLLVAIATGLGFLKVNTGRKLLMLGVSLLVLVCGSGCNNPTPRLELGSYEKELALTQAQKIVNNDRTISVKQWEGWINSQFGGDWGYGSETLKINYRKEVWLNIVKIEKSNPSYRVWTRDDVLGALRIN